VQLCATRIVYNYAMRICAVLCGVVFWSGLLAQEARLQDDSRLQETLAIQKPFASLREVLRTVQEATGVPLYADRAIADDKVCVLTRERPAHEILTRLAQTLRYRWQPSADGKGYRLVQPASERVREQSLLRAYEQARIDAIQKPLREVMQLLRRYTRQQLEQLAADPQSRLSPEAHALLKWAVDETPVALGLHALATLPDSALQRLAHGEPIAFSSHPKFGELPMPQPLRRKVVEFCRPVPEEAIQKAAVRFFVDPTRVVLRCALVFDTNLPDSGDWNDISFRYIAIRRFVNGKTELIHIFDIMHTLVRSEEVIARHPQSAVWREWHSEAEAFRALKSTPTRAPALTIPEPIRRSPLVALIRYAREHGLDLYADAYRIRLLLGNERERTPQTDFEQARSQFFWVRLEGDALMARYRAYPLLRSSEIPEPLLEPLEQKLRAKQEITLDEWAAFATQLTPMQLARAEGWIRLAGQPASHETLAPLENLVVALPALRFWASLSPQQRQAALNGERLLLERMTPKQRELFLQVFSRPLPDLVGAPLIKRYVHEGNYGSLSVRIGSQGETITMTTRIGNPPPPHFRIGRSVQRIEKTLITMQSEDGSEITLEGYQTSDFLRPSSGSPRGWLLYFAVDDWQRAYILLGE
jgi:hypothetical protein